MQLSARLVRNFSAMLIAASSVLLVACTSTPTQSGQELNSTDQADLVALIQNSAAAWNRADLKGHLSIYDASVTVMTKTGPRPTIQAIEDSFGKTYFTNGKPNQNLRMENITVRGLSESSALTTGRFVLSGGNKPEQSGWFTLVWVRTSAGWRAVHDHTS